MFRILICALTLLGLSPGLAGAWMLTAKIGSGNGTVSTGTQSVGSGSGYFTIPNGTPASVTVTPGPGYSVSMVVLDNTQITHDSTSYTVDSPYNKNRTLIAYFTPATWSVTLSQASGGILFAQLVKPTIGPTSRTRLDGIPSGSTVKVTASPNLDYLLTGISVGGVPVWSGSSFDSREYLLTMDGSRSVSATFSLILRAKGALTVATTRAPVYKEVQLDASGSTTNDPPLKYSFAVTSGDASKVTFGSTGELSPRATFLARAPGSYAVTVTATSAHGVTTKATTPIIEVLDAGAFSSQLCTSCHGGRDPFITSSYLSSEHAVAIGAPTCATCHNPENIGHFSIEKPVESCSACHVDSSGTVPRHPFAMGENVCVDCHDPHNPTGSASATAKHFNNMSGAGYPASYVTSRSSCTDCHFGSPENAVVRGEWGGSGHADTRGAPFVRFDFKTISGCVQCHTTTGFIAYSSARAQEAWGTASDKTKEVITCKACHSDIIAGTVRAVTPAQPFADDPYRNRQAGKSNVCFDCHSGRNNGTSIILAAEKGDVRDYPFITPHKLAAGASLHATGGYHYPGQSYDFYSTNTHREIGIGNKAGTGSSGPCVACHMSASKKHLFSATTVDSNGAITGISSGACARCHGDSLGVPQLRADRDDFANALTALREMLGYKGFTYTGKYPYFSNTNWGSGEEGAKTMGAAFNFVWLAAEPGAYAHNMQYARKLLLDSIDYLDNNQLDDSVATLAIPTLRDAGRISREIADSVLAYRTKDACASCHGGTASSGAPMATGAHRGHLSAAYGPGFYLGSGTGACQACHLTGSAAHVNGSVDVARGTGSACQGCHAGGAPAWTLSGRLDCGSCHAATAARLPNGVAAPFKENFAGTGHGRYAASNRCIDCHDADGSHISGSLGSYTRLILVNDNNLCAACHNDAALVRPSYRNMSTHVAKDGRILACRDCHDPHGSSNASMIRTTIKGSLIVFTGENQAVDLAGNRGLCQVCHTQTDHFRAGIAERNHFTSACLSCHTHNTAGGAFRPSGYCDTCHGYPPAPKGETTFGIQGSWTSARYEDYSSGGGSHLTAGHVARQAKAGDGWNPCLSCHFGGAPGHRMAVPVSSHRQNVEVVFDPGLRLSGDSTPTYSVVNRTGSCSNIYCHSDGTSVATGQGSGGTPTWGATLGCSGCHAFPPAYGSGFPKANSHTSHNFGCNSCHAATTSDGTTISEGSRHGNRSYDVTPGAGVSFTYVYSATGGTCSNISCHNYNSAVWGTTLSCGDCHTESPGGD